MLLFVRIKAFFLDIVQAQALQFNKLAAIFETCMFVSESGFLFCVRVCERKCVHVRVCERKCVRARVCSECSLLLLKSLSE